MSLMWMSIKQSPRQRRKGGHLGRRHGVRQIAFWLPAIASVAGFLASTAPASGPVDEEAVPIFGIKISPPDTATGGCSPWPTKKAT